MKKILTVLLICSAAYSYGQDALVSSIQWNVVEVKTSNSPTSESVSDKLKVYPGDRIEWTDLDNNAKFSFKISSTTGDWSNIAEGGLIHYNFQMEGQPGEVIIQRTAGLLSAEIQLYKVDANPLTYFLKISGYSVL